MGFRKSMTKPTTRYYEKPKLIKAIQLQPDWWNDLDSLPEWLRPEYDSGNLRPPAPAHIQDKVIAMLYLGYNSPIYVYQNQYIISEEWSVYKTMEENAFKRRYTLWKEEEN